MPAAPTQERGDTVVTIIGHLLFPAMQVTAAAAGILVGALNYNEVMETQNTGAGSYLAVQNVSAGELLEAQASRLLNQMTTQSISGEAIEVNTGHNPANE
jgi:hypothetical protein